MAHHQLGETKKKNVCQLAKVVFNLVSNLIQMRMRMRTTPFTNHYRLYSTNILMGRFR